MPQDPYGLEATSSTPYTPLLPGFMNSLPFGLGTMAVQIGAEHYGSPNRIAKAAFGPKGFGGRGGRGSSRLITSWKTWGPGRVPHEALSKFLSSNPVSGQRSQFKMLEDLHRQTGGTGGRANRIRNLSKANLTWTQRERTLHRETTRILGKSAANRLAVSRIIGGAMRAFNILWMVDLGITGAQMAYEFAAGRRPEVKPYQRRSLETGGDFVDTRLAQTQRARAIQAIHNTQMSTRAVLGSEAAHMHRY